MILGGVGHKLCGKSVVCSEGGGGGREKGANYMYTVNVTSLPSLTAHSHWLPPSLHVKYDDIQAYPSIAS